MGITGRRVSVWVLLAALPFGGASRDARAQVARGPDSVWTPPAVVRRAVEARIAAAWRVAPGDVRTTWLANTGSATLPDFTDPTPDAFAPGGAYQLHALASGGYWILRSVGPTGRTSMMHIRAGTPHLVARTAGPVPTGTLLGQSDVVWDAEYAWGAPPTTDTLLAWQRPPVGYRTRRALRAGERVVGLAATPRLAVERGDTVTVMAAGRAVSIAWRGVAVNPGSPGSTIAVRLGPGQVMSATVTGPGTAIQAGPSARASRRLTEATTTSPAFSTAPRPARPDSGAPSRSAAY